MPYLVIKNKIVQEEYSVFPSDKMNSFSAEESDDFENQWEVVGDPKKPYGTEDKAIAVVRNELKQASQNQFPSVMSKFEKVEEVIASLEEVLARLANQLDKQSPDDEDQKKGQKEG